MARDLTSFKSTAVGEVRRRSQEARRRLIPEGMAVSIAAQHGEAREVAVRVAAGNTPTAAVVDADFPMLKRVRAELGMTGVSNRATAWLARYNALADIDRAEAVALAAINSAGTVEDVRAAGAAFMTAIRAI